MGIISDLLSVIFPRVCEVCGESLIDGEQHICLACLHKMPRLNYHISENPFSRRMAAAKISKTAVMFAYVKGNEYAQLIQTAKYNHRPEIVKYLSTYFAKELGADFFDDIDMIIPVPMHWLKKILRGFNQAEYIADGIYDAIGIPVCHNIIATKGHDTQTRKSMSERIKNTKNIFDIVNSEDLKNKHILIVDDVVTTGSTLLSCADTIREHVSNVQISILALAGARQS